MNRLAFGLLIAGTIGSFRLNAAETLRPAQVIKHTQGNGQVVQAILFQLNDSSPGVVAHDHAIFVDTSASQVGAHRLLAMTVLESALRALPQTDRIRLFAIDVEAEPLMSSFADVQSTEVQNAVDILKERIPLGATNLQILIETALNSKQAERACSVVYIGDGMSTADLLETSELASLVSRLRDEQMPLHSYGVGPQINLQVLGILAHQTGGYVDFDRRVDSSEDEMSKTEVAIESGSKLGTAVQRPVIFPVKVQLNSQPMDSLPLLALRTDRQTIHVIRGDLPEASTMTFTTRNPDLTIEWALSVPVEGSDTAFLVAASQQIENDRGLSNPLAGRDLMQVFQRTFETSVEDALQLGAKHLTLGHGDEAAEIARRVSEAVPTNSEAKFLVAESQRLLARQVSQSADKKEKADLEAHAQPQPDASLTRAQQEVIRVKTEKLRNQVSSTIEESKRLEPESGLVRLKQISTTVRTSLDVADEDRLQLQKRLESEIRQLRNRAEKVAQERVQLAEHLSQLEAQRRLTEQLELDEEKLEGLIERVRGLMYEGKHGRDDAYAEAQNVADVAIDLRPGSGTATAARFNSEAAHQLTRAFRLRARRADQVLETLHMVELSHIPFPDEPPVRFPPAEVWSALTERREKWKEVDLRSESPRERRIQSELKNLSEANFVDVPLKEAIDVLKSNHNIEIQFDTKALNEDGISTDQPVNLTLSGVTLRSLLRWMLTPMQLTYVIKDEVLMITTQAAADADFTTRVYPVADLVMPIRSPMMGGGMMGGGMGGGMMGGGMGGGMMGGGMMGGGGMFSIPAEPNAPFARTSTPVDSVKMDIQKLNTGRRIKDIQ